MTHEYHFSIMYLGSTSLGSSTKSSCLKNSIVMPEVRCKLENCPVAETGDCLEGLSLEACPNLDEYEGSSGKAPEEVAIEPLESEPVPTELLATGASLSGQNLRSIMHQVPCTLIVIAGEVATGKTTLLVGLYEAFQQGPLGNYNFAGSETLVAFEERCHFSRIASGMPKADTERTRRTQVLPFLHLAVESNGLHRHLLLSDISGEVFNDIVDSQEATASISELKRADHFLVILDGERLADPTKRQAHVARTATALRSLVQSGTLRTHTKVHLLVSKWDLFAPHLDTSKALLDQAFKRLTRYLSSYHISTHMVAARSASDADVEDGWGLGTLLAAIVERSYPERDSDSLALQIAPKRAYLNYRLSTSMEKDTSP
jgi:hypothetical protein